MKIWLIAPMRAGPETLGAPLRFDHGGQADLRLRRQKAERCTEIKCHGKRCGAAVLSKNAFRDPEKAEALF
ncbi:MAG: hypothetical protein AAGH41_13905 [Pseudomonadota bacterium]